MQNEANPFAHRFTERSVQNEANAWWQRRNCSAEHHLCRARFDGALASIPIVTVASREVGDLELSARFDYCSSPRTGDFADSDWLN